MADLHQGRARFETWTTKRYFASCFFYSFTQLLQRSLPETEQMSATGFSPASQIIMSQIHTVF